MAHTYAALFFARFMTHSRSPKDAIAASKAALACTSLVTSSGTVQTLSEYLSSSSTSCSGLRSVATTRSPASSTASVNARPRPREAPVMSQTFDINPLFAIHRKSAVDETVNRAIFTLMHRSAWSLQRSSTAGAMQLPRSELQPPSAWTCGQRWQGHETCSPGTKSAKTSGTGLRSTLHSRRSRTAALTDGRGGCQTVAGRIERKRFGAVFLFCDTFAVQ